MNILDAADIDYGLAHLFTDSKNPIAVYCKDDAKGMDISKILTIKVLVLY